MEFGGQRIQDAMLRDIEAELQTLFRALNIGNPVTPLVFGDVQFTANANYFELPREWLAVCYSYRGKSHDIPLFQLLNQDQLPTDSDELIVQHGDIDGFSGMVVTQQGGAAHPAVFLNSSRNAPRTACHTLIHEFVHMHSYQSVGFQESGFFSNWGEQGPPAGLESGFYGTLDEGTTEMFARIVGETLRKKENGPQVLQYGGIWVYEFPMSAVCDLAKNLGIKKIAKAFFTGDPGLQQTLQKKSKDAQSASRYSTEYFLNLSEIEPLSGHYARPDKAAIEAAEAAKPIQDRNSLAYSAAMSKYRSHLNHIKHLRDFNVEIPTVDQLIHSIENDAYNHPSIVTGPSFSKTLLVTLGVAAGFYGICKAVEQPQ